MGLWLYFEAEERRGVGKMYLGRYIGRFPRICVSSDRFKIYYMTRK